MSLFGMGGMGGMGGMSGSTGWPHNPGMGRFGGYGMQPQQGPQQGPQFQMPMMGGGDAGQRPQGPAPFPAMPAGNPGLMAGQGDMGRPQPAVLPAPPQSQASGLAGSVQPQAPSAGNTAMASQLGQNALFNQMSPEEQTQYMQRRFAQPGQDYRSVDTTQGANMASQLGQMLGSQGPTQSAAPNPNPAGAQSFMPARREADTGYQSMFAPQRSYHHGMR